MDTSPRGPCVPSTAEGFRGAERIGTRGSRVLMAGPAAADAGTRLQARGTKDRTSQSAKTEAEAQR